MDVEGYIEKAERNLAQASAVAARLSAGTDAHRLAMRAVFVLEDTVFVLSSLTGKVSGWPANVVLRNRI